MAISKKSVGLVTAGFLLGTIGLKALKSEPARKCYVQGVAGGLRLKAAYESVVEEAKAQVDDIVAEATYLNEQACAKAQAEPAPEAEPQAEAEAGACSAAE